MLDVPVHTPPPLPGAGHRHLVASATADGMPDGWTAAEHLPGVILPRDLGDAMADRLAGMRDREGAPVGSWALAGRRRRPLAAAALKERGR